MREPLCLSYFFLSNSHFCLLQNAENPCWTRVARTYPLQSKNKDFDFHVIPDGYRFFVVNEKMGKKVLAIKRHSLLFTPSAEADGHWHGFFHKGKKINGLVYTSCTPSLFGSPKIPSAGLLRAFARCTASQAVYTNDGFEGKRTVYLPVA